MCYNEIFAGVTEDIEQCTWSEEDTGGLGIMTTVSSRMLMKTFDKQGDFVLYNLEQQLVVHIVEDIEGFETPFQIETQMISLMSTLTGFQKNFAEETNKNDGKQ